MTDSANFVHGLAAGLGGAVLSLIGADTPMLTAAFIGCVIGVVHAPPVGRVHATCLFVAAVSAAAMSASGLTPMVSAWLPEIAPVAVGKGIALLAGALLHPTIQALSEAVPGLIKGVAEKLGSKA